MTFVCKATDCSTPHRSHQGRGLCAPCYKRANTRRAVNPDTNYRRWLLSTRLDVPREVVMPWIEAMVAERGDVLALAHLAGVDEAIIRRLVLGTKKGVSLATAEKLAMASNRLVELAIAVPAPGEDDWSPLGRSCGDGSGFDGCGSWFHSHHEGGLCEECHRREVLGWPIEPRDVRVTREAREKEVARA